MDIFFKEVSSTRTKRIFKEVLKHYTELEEANIILHQRKMPKTTMRAQPKLFSLLFGTNTYKVELSNNTDLEDHVRIEQLPDEVLRGWFAHELGHVVDYLGRGFLGMLWFGLRYLSSKKFRVRTEHEADIIAVRHGFSDSILHTKRYILEHSGLSERYKARIKKYYLSIDDIGALLEAEENKALKLDEVNIFTPSAVEKETP